ncbi:hypothetical protein CG403_06265, partial [Gardnerella vaginalis]
RKLFVFVLFVSILRFERFTHFVYS